MKNDEQDETIKRCVLKLKMFILFKCNSNLQADYLKTSQEGAEHGQKNLKEKKDANFGSLAPQIFSLLGSLKET